MEASPSLDLNCVLTKGPMVLLVILVILELDTDLSGRGEETGWQSSRLS